MSSVTVPIAARDEKYRASERVEFVSNNRPRGRGAGVRAYHEGMADLGFQHELSDRCDPALISILRRQTAEYAHQSLLTSRQRRRLGPRRGVLWCSALLR
jgi:hypothetical protein